MRPDLPESYTVPPAQPVAATLSGVAAAPRDLHWRDAPLGERIATLDWSSSLLAVPARWSSALHTILGLVLHHPQPMLLLWGTELTCFYNQAFAESLGPELHPALLGAPVRLAAPTLWPAWHRGIEAVLAGLPVPASEEQPLQLARQGREQTVWWRIVTSPVLDDSAARGIGGVLLSCTDVTRRVVSDRRLAFQLKLSAELRELDDPQRIKQTAARLLGEALNADRCGYARIEASDDWAVVEADWTRGFANSVVGRHHLGDFGPRMVSALRAGRVTRIDDVRLDPLSGSGDFARAHEQVGALSGLTVPMIRSGRLAAALFVHQTEPRAWTDDEQALVEDVAERTWDAVQRAEAEAILRQREAELLELDDTLELQVDRLLGKRKFMADVVELNAMPIAACDTDCNLLAINPSFIAQFERHHGLRVREGQNLLDLLSPWPELCDQTRLQWARALRGEALIVVDRYDPASPDQPCYEYRWSLLRDRAGRLLGALQFGVDVSARLRAEAR